MNDENKSDLDSGTWEVVGEPKIRLPGFRIFSGPTILRMKVPGGWLVIAAANFSHPVTFYPDANHEWNPPIIKK